MATILLIGSAGTKHDSFRVALEKRYTLFTAPSGKSGVAIGKNHHLHVVVVDAVSLRTPGDRICRLLRKRLPDTPLILLLPEDANTSNKSEDSADVILVEPFTWRKVVNNIERLLNAVDDHIITCGPFAMNKDRRVLLAHGQETALTPKQALLIEMFLRHPGETLPRKMLMQKVWDTDYMGDTRTLDVHIRWIRQALESDARNPHYLKTVRGVGYRLEIPNQNAK